MNAGEKTLDWLMRDQLKVDEPWLLRRTTGFTWWPHKNAQRIEIVGEEEGPDGDTGYLIRVETDFLRNFDRTERNLAAVNSVIMPVASMAGPVYDEQSRSLKLCSLVRVYENTRPWMSSLISMASVLQISEAQRMAKKISKVLGAEADESGHPHSGVRNAPDELAGIIESAVIPVGRQPCRWTEEEFDDALKNHMQKPPTLLATGGGLGFTAEFIYGKDSSICRCTGDESHPIYGSGLTLTQSFPIGDRSEAKGAQAALAFNRIELTQKPFGYGFGSYFFRDGMINFTTFIPNMAYRNGLVPSLFFACAGRAKEMSIRLAKTDWTTETFQIAFERRSAFWKAVIEARHMEHDRADAAALERQAEDLFDSVSHANEEKDLKRREAALADLRALANEHCDDASIRKWLAWGLFNTLSYAKDDQDLKKRDALLDELRTLAHDHLDDVTVRELFAKGLFKTADYAKEEQDLKRRSTLLDELRVLAAIHRDDRVMCKWLAAGLLNTLNQAEAEQDLTRRDALLEELHTLTNDYGEDALVRGLFGEGLFNTLHSLKEEKDLKRRDSLLQELSNLAHEHRDDAAVRKWLAEGLFNTLRHAEEQRNLTRRDAMLEELRTLTHDHGDSAVCKRLAEGLFYTLVDAREQQDLERRDALLDELRKLVHDHPGYTALREWLARGLFLTRSYVQREQDLKRGDTLLDELRSLVYDHPGDAELRKWLVRGLFETLIDAEQERDPQRRDTLLDELRTLANDHASDEVVRERLAKALLKTLIDAIEERDLKRRDALLEELRTLTDDYPDDAAVREQFAQGLFNTLDTLPSAPKEQDLKRRDALLEELRTLASEHPADALARELLAKNLFNTLVAHRFAQSEQGLQKRDTALEELRTLAHDHADHAAILGYLAEGLFNTLTAVNDLSNRSTAVSEKQRLERRDALLEELRRLAHSHHGDVAVGRQLAKGLFHTLYYDRDHLERRNALLDELRTLADHYPVDATVREQLAKSLFDLLTEANNMQDLQRRNALLEQLNTLVDEYPDDAVVREQLAKGLINTLDYLLYAPEEQDLERWDSLLESVRSLAHGHPSDLVVQERLAKGLFNSLAVAQNDPKRRDTFLDEFHALAQAYPNDDKVCRWLAWGLFDALNVAQQEQDLKQRDKLLDALRTLGQDHNEDYEIRNWLAQGLFSTLNAAQEECDLKQRDALLEELRTLARLDALDDSRQLSLYDDKYNDVVLKRFAEGVFNTLNATKEEGDLLRRDALLEELRGLAHNNPEVWNVRNWLAKGLLDALKDVSAKQDVKALDTLLEELRNLAHVNPHDRTMRVLLAEGLYDAFVAAHREKDLTRCDALQEELRNLANDHPGDSALGEWLKKGPLDCRDEIVKPSQRAKELFEGIDAAKARGDLERRDALLEELRALADQHCDDADVRRRFAASLLNTFYAAEEGQDLEQCDALLQELRTLANSHNDDDKVRDRLATGLFNAIYIYDSQDEKNLERRNALLEELQMLALHHPGDVVVRELLAESLSNTIISAKEENDLTRRDALLEELRFLVHDHPDDDGVREWLANGLFNVHINAKQEKDLKRRDALLEELRTLAHYHPADSAVCELLAQGVFNTLNHANEEKDLKRRDALLEELRTLAHDYPRDAALRELLAKGLFNALSYAQEAMDLGGGNALLEELHTLGHDHPDDPAVRAWHAAAVVNSIYHAKEELELKRLDALIDELRTLADHYPDDIAVREWLSKGLFNALANSAVRKSLKQRDALLEELGTLARNHPADAAVCEVFAKARSLPFNGAQEELVPKQDAPPDFGKLKSILELQDTLPKFIQLLRYGPNRMHSSLRDKKAAVVRRPSDLPPYLILGNLDENSFRMSSSGWSARWNGPQGQTYFEAKFIADQTRYEFHQVWRGMDGGRGLCSSQASIEEAVAKCPFLRLPPNWESALKAELERKHHLSFAERPEKLITAFYSPDGFFFTVAFPVAVNEIAHVKGHMEDALKRSEFNYPVMMAARRVFHVVNYLEGKAPTWTTEPMTVFKRSLLESGLIPRELPVRETAKDGSSAWTLRREIYFLFINVPFAGLCGLLDLISDQFGPFRSVADPPLRFEWWPIVMPTGLEVQAESVAFFDRNRTTRSFLSFALPGRAVPVPSLEETMDSLKNSSALIQQAEWISSKIVETATQKISATADSEETSEGASQDASVSINKAARDTKGVPLACQECGTKNPVSSAYCFNCGTAIDTPPVPEVPGKGRLKPTTPLLLQGLNSEESLLTVWKLLFSPSLRHRFGFEWSRQWCESLIDSYLVENHAGFSAQCHGLAVRVQQVLSQGPQFSMEHPPWAMFSLDFRFGMIPWVTPGFDQFLLRLFSRRTAIPSIFGDVLPVAFINGGGPAGTEETAFRICAPSQAARASAEHWLMRAYLRRREEGAHATVSSPASNQTFSVHEYKDQRGLEKRVFFETSESFGREEEDFLDFLYDERV